MNSSKKNQANITEYSSIPMINISLEKLFQIYSSVTSNSNGNSNIKFFFDFFKKDIPPSSLNNQNPKYYLNINYNDCQIKYLFLRNARNKYYIQISDPDEKYSYLGIQTINEYGKEGGFIIGLQRYITIRDIKDIIFQFLLSVYSSVSESVLYTIFSANILEEVNILAHSIKNHKTNNSQIRKAFSSIIHKTGQSEIINVNHLLQCEEYQTLITNYENLGNTIEEFNNIKKELIMMDPINFKELYLISLLVFGCLGVKDCRITDSSIGKTVFYNRAENNFKEELVSNNIYLYPYRLFLGSKSIYNRNELRHKGIITQEGNQNNLSQTINHIKRQKLFEYVNPDIVNPDIDNYSFGKRFKSFCKDMTVLDFINLYDSIFRSTNSINYSNRIFIKDFSKMISLITDKIKLNPTISEFTKYLISFDKDKIKYFYDVLIKIK